MNDNDDNEDNSFLLPPDDEDDEDDEDEELIIDNLADTKILLSPTACIPGRTAPDDETDLTTTGTLSDRGKKRAMLKKAENLFIRNQFTVAYSQERKCLEIMCIHCSGVKFWQKFNASNATYHIVQACKEAPNNVKRKARASTQASKKMKQLTSIISQSATGTFSMENSKNVVSSSRASIPHQSATKMLRATTMKSFGRPLNKEMVHHIIRTGLETSLSQFEPISHIFDDFYQNELAQAYGMQILRMILDH